MKSLFQQQQQLQCTKPLQCVKLIHRLGKRIRGRHSTSLKSWWRQTQDPALKDIMWLSAWGCRLCFLAWGVDHKEERDSGLVLAPCTAPHVCVRTGHGAWVWHYARFHQKMHLFCYLLPYLRNGFTSPWEGAAGSAAGIGVKRQKQPTTSNLRGVRQILSINCWNKTGWGDSPQKKIHGRFLSSKQCF